jgi:magnesium chelatase subunit D
VRGIAASNSDNTFLRGLSCAALDPALRSVLVFDCSPSTLRTATSDLAAMLQAVTGRSAEVVTLSSAHSEEDLWARPSIFQFRLHAKLVWKFRGLAQSGSDPAPRIVCIPDLTRLSLPAERACVALTGAPMGILQRHGLDLTWVPHLFWLAACKRDRIGELSPHLLDRFAMRLNAPLANATDRVTDVVAWVTGVSLPVNESSVTPLLTQLQMAAPVPPVITAAALSRTQNLLRDTEAEGLRRQLALARLGRALAWLGGALEVTDKDIDEAAKLIGLAVPLSLSPNSPQPEAIPVSMPSVTRPASAPVATPTRPLDNTSDVTTTSEEFSVDPGVITAPDSEMVFPASSISRPSDPYPEDSAPILRNQDSLQMPPRRYRADTAAGGPIIGVQHATDLRDLALFETILEATKYRFVRSRQAKHNSELQFARTDLRSYRREHLPEQLLVLVLDYTCLHARDWQEALLPHLSWAYVERASICLVQVGVRSARNQLRAQTVVARRLLSPDLRTAFQSPPGVATPLAHGLELAERFLRTALQHGRATIQKARLVVLSDGRGNVPLDASHAGRLLEPVAQQGIDDALRIAEVLSSLSHLERIFLNPEPRQQADLPLALARALNAIIEPVAELQTKDSES